METVNKYLINEGKVDTAIGKIVKMWHNEQIKLAKKFEVQIKKAVDSIDDLEGLENFRDMGLNRIADLDDQLAYAVGDVVDKRIDALWQEDMATQKGM